MDLTITDKAVAKLQELLASAGRDAHVRILLHCSGCLCGCSKDYELKLLVESSAVGEKDLEFAIHGMAFVMDSEMASKCPPNRRIGLAAVPG
jgi:Uncharacterized conserved protein